MSPHSSAGEALFFDIYEYVCQKADYLQPEDRRWDLPEIVVTSLTTTIILAFLNGFFGKLGQDLFDKVKEIAVGTVGAVGKGKLKTCNSADLIEYLNRVFPDIKEQRARIDEVEALIRGEIVGLGVSERAAEAIAKDIIHIIWRHVTHGNS